MRNALDVQEERESGGWQVLSYATRGHHDPAAFVAALERDWGVTCAPEHVRHEHRRVVPCGEDGELVQILAEPGTRGAYPVTMVEVEHTRPSLRVVPTPPPEEP